MGGSSKAQNEPCFPPRGTDTAEYLAKQHGVAPVTESNTSNCRIQNECKSRIIKSTRGKGGGIDSLLTNSKETDSLSVIDGFNRYSVNTLINQYVTLFSA